MRLRSLMFGLAALFVVASITSLASAQPGRPGGFGGGGFGNGPTDLLRRNDVGKELGLLDEQKKDLEGIGEKVREQARELFSGLQGLSDEERREKFGELREKMTKITQDEIDKILLPHQSKRLGQLVMQRQLRGGTGAALRNPDIAKELGLSESDQEKIGEKTAEFESELREKLAALRKEYSDKLLKELSPAQRKKFEAMVGEPFEFDESERVQFNFGGGGRGGRGGGNRGGNGGDGGGRPQRPEAN